ncbi:MAG TPA: hypothetical protein VFV09_04880 [Actinomycetota bacterium]|nr:hypothetical protein [Actinomycetota bacterium]
MFERLENILSQLQAFVEGFDASGLDRAQSLELYERLCVGERMMHAAKALAGKQLADCRAWYETGYKSTAHFMAATAGTTSRTSATCSRSPTCSPGYPRPTRPSAPER